MDLKGLLNDGPAEETKRKSPEEQRERPPLPSSQSSYAQPPTPASYGYQSHQQTPLYAPPGASPPRFPPSQGLTPLQTPHQQAGPGQYPFPQHVGPSPAGGVSAQPYGSQNPSSATTPFARPSSQGYTFPPPHQSHALPIGASHGPLPPYASTSQSPTPPLHRSPQSIRQSPSSARSHLPNQPPPYGHYHQQPTTPLGPPPLHQRYSNFADMQSPSHQRTYSSTSNGIISGSPAHHSRSGSTVADSPGTYQRPPHQQQQSSDYLSIVDRERERSVSVSPKTKVPPRPTSMGSRNSSHQEIPSRGSSVQAVIPGSAHAANYTPLAGSPDHVTPRPQLPFGVAPQPPSEVAQSSLPPSHGMPSAPSTNVASQVPALSQLPPQRPPLIHHSSSKMGMDHLLTPTSDMPPSVNGSSASIPTTTTEVQPTVRSDDVAVKTNVENLSSHSGSTPTDKAESAPNQQTKGAQSQLQKSSSYTQQSVPSKGPVDQQAPELTTEFNYATGEMTSHKKRPADSEPSEEPPSKQQKMRKYTLRPVWARLSKHNPRYNPAQQSNDPAPQPNGAGPSHMNGGPPSRTNGAVQRPGQDPAPDGRPPWEYKYPFDDDLISARSVLGGTWEKSMKWNTPYPDMLRTVQDWLYQELENLSDAGRDSKEGTIEIEARIGRLMRDGERCKLPVKNAVVIEPEHAQHYTFQSAMTEPEHKAFNSFMNKEVIVRTHDRGRARMTYEHLRETDSFYPLSSLGLEALPTAMNQRRGTRPPRLRLTKNDDQKKTTGRQIIAKIVKVPISNLHIFNPRENHDCRISINLEVNLDRPELADVDALIAHDKDVAREVDRKKDRIAYKHLYYSIDLTKVERANLAPTFELELEVDSNRLREQIDLIKAGQPNAYGDVVSGFLDNAMFLMRAAPKV